MPKETGGAENENEKTINWEKEISPTELMKTRGVEKIDFRVAGKKTLATGTKIYVAKGSFAIKDTGYVLIKNSRVPSQLRQIPDQQPQNPLDSIAHIEFFTSDSDELMFTVVK